MDVVQRRVLGKGWGTRYEIYLYVNIRPSRLRGWSSRGGANPVPPRETDRTRVWSESGGLVTDRGSPSGVEVTGLFFPLLVSHGKPLTLQHPDSHHQ